MARKQTKEGGLVREILEQVAKMPIEEVMSDLDAMEMDDVAGKLKCGRSTAYNLVNEGKLPGFKIGTLTRVRPRALYAFILIKEKQGLGKAA